MQRLLPDTHADGVLAACPGITPDILGILPDISDVFYGNGFKIGRATPAVNGQLVKLFNGRSFSHSSDIEFFRAGLYQAPGGLGMLARYCIYDISCSKFVFIKFLFLYPHAKVRVGVSSKADFADTCYSREFI